MNKEYVSRNYMDRQKEEHAAKVLRPDAERTATVFGAEDQASIGWAVVTKMFERGFRVLSPSKTEVDIRYAGHLASYFRMHQSDTLICSHGLTHLDWIEDQAPKTIQEVIDVNLTGSIFAASLFAKATMSTPYRKQIVFIGSMAYNHVLNGSAPYCAAKAGLAHFAKCLAWELAPKGFDVFCIHPSNTLGTAMTEATIQGIMRYRKLNRDDAEAYWGATLPREQWLKPEDIAETVSMVTREGMSYLSGANLELGGGQR